MYKIAIFSSRGYDLGHETMAISSFIKSCESIAHHAHVIKLTNFASNSLQHTSLARLPTPLSCPFELNLNIVHCRSVDFIKHAMKSLH